MTAAESDASWRGLRSIGCRLQTKRAYESMTIRTRIRIIGSITTIIRTLLDGSVRDGDAGADHFHAILHYQVPVLTRRHAEQ